MLVFMAAVDPRSLKLKKPSKHKGRDADSSHKPSEKERRRSFTEKPDPRRWDEIPELVEQTTRPNHSVLFQHPPSEVRKSIATGHAVNKHVDTNEFKHLGIRDTADFYDHITDVINNPTSWKKLSDGRVAFWDQQTKTIVVYDPNRRRKYNPNRGKKEEDLGTAFISTTGKQRFDELQ